MSGPKTVRIPTGSSEEAARLYRQMSGRTKVNTEIHGNTVVMQVNYGSEYWYNTSKLREEAYRRRSEIQAELLRDREEFERRLREQLESQKKTEFSRIDTSVRDSEKQIERSRKEVDRVMSSLESLEKKSTESVKCKFGDLIPESIENKIEDIRKRLNGFKLQLSNYENTYKGNAEDYRRRIQSVTSIDEFNKLKRSAPTLSPPNQRLGDDSDSLEREVRKRREHLERMATALDTIYQELVRNDLLDEVRGTIQEAIAARGPSEDLIVAIREHVSKCIEKKLRNMAAEKSAAETERLNKLMEQITSELESVSKQLIVSEVDNAVNRVYDQDLTEKNTELLKQCNESIQNLQNLDYLSQESTEKLRSCRTQVDKLKHLLKYKKSFDELSDLSKELDSLFNRSSEESVKYIEFKDAYEEYSETHTEYLGLQGIVEGGPEFELKNMQYLFDSGMTLEELRNKTERLQSIISNYRKMAYHDAVLEAVSKSKADKLFRTENKEGGAHIYFTREDCKGALIDVECGDTGEIKFRPRMVKLHNGEMLIDKDRFNTLQHTCNWIGGVQDYFKSNLKLDLEYSEIEDEKEAMLKEENYFVCEDVEMSLLLMIRSGYSWEEIKAKLKGDLDKLKHGNLEIEKFLQQAASEEEEADIEIAEASEIFQELHRELP